MNQDLSTSRIYTDFQGLSDLRLAASQNSEEALREVAGQFEAIFIQMMLKSMRDASLSEGVFDSQQSEMYMGMFDQQIALDLSVKGAFGIAEMMVRQLQNNQANSVDPDSVTESAVKVRSSRQSRVSENTPEFESPQSFIDYMLPRAEAAAKTLGVSPQLLVAQAALETGWGKAVVEGADQQSSHNLFGIKADRRWTGKTAEMGTLEFRNGIPQREQASFRAYDSFEQSFADYAEFVQQGPRYQEAMQHNGNARHYIEGLQAAGYATDPAYAEKVITIMEREFS
ncbi:MAG: flagellar assembly peptidoglycan hydrolase FlgJ [Gammaproteobacteria bacterium]|nr:flagellar assembly peptidoglycan hydrolase FlgJ [Gammaproteobacteria bacterium]